MQILTGTCGNTLHEVDCYSSSPFATSGLTIGTTYWIRLFSTNNSVPSSTGDYTICVTDPAPANDNCSNATTLTSGLSCVNTTGTLTGATFTAGTPVGCGITNRNDVWYKFVAQSDDPTISLSSAPANSHLQLFSGTCGALVSVACGNGSLTATGLTLGDTYYVRVCTDPNASGTFNICITDQPAANDLCSGAISLTVNSTCAKTMGTLAKTTVSNPSISLTGPGSCSGTAGLDVWYKFVANSANTTISIADFGTNFGSTRRFQLFTGACGSLSAVTCVTGTGSSISLPTSTTLTPGTTYYVRVVSNITSAPTTNADFSICVSTPPPTQRFGNGYINVTKQTSGGVVEPGDILEIRMTVNLTSGSIYKMRYLDSIPTHTTIENGPGDRLRVLTNEGFAIQNYTLNSGDDAGSYKPTLAANESPIRMNLGFNGTITPPSPGVPANNTATESASATGQLTAGNIPNVFGAALFATGFRVKVTGVVGDTIVLGTPKFVYKTSTGGADITYTGTPYKILISEPLSLCANSTGVNMSQEFGGTFGTGTTLNRPTDLAFPIPGYAFTNISPLQALGDGQYAIVKNMSPRSGINRDAERASDPTVAVLPNQNAKDYRMHGGHWDIDGDHTGANDAIGNIPLADGVNAGYMLMVNADYVASETYRQTLTNLCPNTYYEFSAWFRNICPTCGNDYTTGNNYSPMQPGVKPNLTFALDGLDKYNTGEISYNNVGVNGTGGGWVKKGFVFVTGPTQNSATFSIRNNSQGGGGNDWAMDDITISTCLPNMEYTPTISPTVCEGSVFKLTDTIRSYFSNYTNYKWQRSTNGPGGPWADVTTPATAATGAPEAGVYKYWTNYNIPQAETTPDNDGDIYRLIVATTADNLSDNACLVTDGVTQITIDVISCDPILKTDLVSFNAKLVSDHGHLSWITTKEEEAVAFNIERSSDGINFVTIGKVSGYDNNGAVNNYSFVDPVEITGKAYYRIAIVANSQGKKYSRTVELHSGVASGFSLNTVVNPFNNAIEFEVTTPADASIDVRVSDIFGKVVKRSTYRISTGVNSLKLSDTGGLAAGTYILVIKNNDQVITKKILKGHNF